MTELESKYARLLQGFLYLTECTLATVDSLAIRKTPPVGEVTRQISMAQRAIQFLLDVNYNYAEYGCRLKEVAEKYNHSVLDYAKAQRKMFHDDELKIRK